MPYSLHFQHHFHPFLFREQSHEHLLTFFSRRFHPLPLSCMRRGINANYHSNKESSLNKQRLNNTSINAMPKNSQRTTAGTINTAANYNLEEMIAYIRQNPDAALGIHQHLTQVTYLQHLNAPVESSTPQTPKRNLDSSDNDGVQVSKQQRV